MSYLIKDLPMDEKPCEKAKKYGISSLSNAELLAILLRCGTKKRSVTDVCQDILKSVGGLEGLRDIRISKLRELYGVGEVKAVTILAAIELGKRVNNPEMDARLQIHESQEVYTLYRAKFLGEKQEKFLVLFLNTKNQILEEKIMFTGTVNQSLVHPRDIFREAVLVNAVKILCIHNHPSGNTTPSIADECMTKKVKEAGEMIGIPLIDHIIIGSQDYYSFLEHKKGGF